MGVPTDGKEGFPRLPFPKTWPDRDDLEREIDNLAKRGAPYPEALKRVLEVIGQYRVLEQQNYGFASRHWGTADVSEEASEHWNYLRNSNFNLSGSPSKYWNQGAGVTSFTQVTTGLPYGVRTAGKIITLGANGHIQQSASAVGATWYTVSSWIYPVSGTLLTLSVTENSGSTSARTHARAWPQSGTSTLVDTWRHLSSHTQPILAWRTYKGTTRQNVKLAITGNQGQFQVAQIQLEKGRRPHPWRPHLLDWGNYVTSLKTAGSASYWGNIVISASGGAIVRQYVGSNRFVYGTRYGATVANPSTSGAVGTAKTLMRSDARVRAVRSIRTPGSASFAGSVVLSASGGAKIRQVAGPPRKFVIGAPAAGASAGSAKPKPVSTSGTAGVAAAYSREDHVHRGVKALRKAGGSSADGTITVSASGVGSAVRMSGAKLIIGPAKPATATPAEPSTSGTVGTGTLWARTDHRHRGVKSVRTPGSASFAGSLVLSASGGAKIRQVAGPPRKFVIGAPAAGIASTAKPKPVSTSGTAGVLAPYSREDHVHRGVKALRKAGGASADGTITLSASGTGSAVRMSGAKAIFGGPKPASATPAAVSSSGTVGTGTLWARTDHRHRGVKALKTATVSAAATVTVSASGTGSAVRISAGKLFIGPPKPATATPAAPSTSGTVGTGTLWARTDHRHRGIKSIRTPGSASFAGSIVLSASGGAKVRQVAGPPRKFVIGAPAAGGGSTNDYDVAGGRLTLTSGTAVTTSDVTAAGTLYYTPYVSDRIGTYSGTTWSVSTFTEKSLALTLTSGKNYDVFIIDSTLALELSAAWTNDTTRANAIVQQNGVWVKSGSTTRRYLGTIRASAANQTEDSTTKRFVWNMYNRVPRPMRAVDTTDNWTYASTTWRQANAAAANKVEFVLGLSGDTVDCTILSLSNSSGVNAEYGVCFGLDSTSAVASGQTYSGGYNTTGALPMSTIAARYLSHPGLGYHYLAWLERTDGNTVYFRGDNGSDMHSSGISGAVLA